MKKQAVIFMGRSGSGKSTQTKLLEQFFVSQGRKPLRVETGALFRSFVEGDSYSSFQARKIQKEGLLQPSFLAILMWGKVLVEQMTEQTSLILDGTHRYINEARVFETAVSFYEFDTPTVVHLDVSREWAKERLLERKRADDTDNQIANRMDWFEERVFPVLEELKKTGSYNVVRVNGEQSIEEVQKDIAKIFS